MARTATLISFVFLAILFTGGYAGTYFNYLNQCPFSVWLAAKPPIGEAMWEYPTETLTIFETPDNWAGSIWLRTKCSGVSEYDFACLTGDCGTNSTDCTGQPPKYPVTLLNFDIKQSVATYEVSLVHGFNVPVRIVPIRGPISCPTSVCAKDITSICPPELAYKSPNGNLIACQSSCNVLKGPNACQPNKVSNVFKHACPLARVQPNDTTTPLVHCTGATYNITFCPTPI